MDFEALTDATAGAVGGLLSTTILYPLDTCKSIYQAEVRAGNCCKYRSLLDVLRDAIGSKQIMSLYQGLAAKNLQSVVSQFIYFYAYNHLKHLYLRRSKSKHMGTGANLLVAAAAGACNSIITHPLDTASSRMQTCTFGKSKGLWHTLSENWKDSFDGIGASLLLTSNPAIQYTAFEQLKWLLLQRRQRRMVEKGIACDEDGGPSLVLSAFSAFLLGALSKTVATLVTYPAIRCKVMLQSGQAERRSAELESKESSRPKSMPSVFYLIWREEGVTGLYKGLQAQILKTILSAALMLMIKEKVTRGTWFFMLALRRWSSSTRVKQLRSSSK